MHYSIDRLEFSGGETVPLDPAGLLILVGPNNCGKSRALRDTETLWNGSASEEQVRVVLNADVSHSTDWDSFDAWLRQHYSVERLDDGRERFVGLDVQFMPPHRGSSNWAQFGVGGFVVMRLDTESRLRLSNPPARIEPLMEQPKHFIHVLQSDERLYEHVQQEVAAAFGLDLEIDYFGGSQIPMFVGEVPEIQNGWDRVHPSYARAVRSQMTPLHEAGDGVRSYVATLASALVGAQPVLLIDEPEAFLHPPQARRLGRTLAESATERGRQVVIATHSSDLIRGALAAGGRVAVCRINRVRSEVGASVNHAYVQSPDDLRSLWEKPLLRSAHTIDGIFHRGVVVCEGDADARLYEALLVLLEDEGTLAEPPDLHFVHGGGKSELPTLANSYNSLGVPVAVIADFDLLRNEDDL